MNWDALGAIGELVGATAVTITLVYLLIQIRQHARSLNATTTQSNIEQFNDLTLLLATNPALVATFDKGCVKPEQLTEEENYTFTWLTRSLMNLYQNLYDQYRQKACPEYLWIRHARELKSICSLPGITLFRQIDPSFEELFIQIEAEELDTYVAGFKLPV